MARSKPQDPVVPAEESPPPKGIRCPFCGCGHLPVIYTRDLSTGTRRRRRQCRACGKAMYTNEKVMGAPQ